MVIPKNNIVCCIYKAIKLKCIQKIQICKQEVLVIAEKMSLRKLTKTIAETMGPFLKYFEHPHKFPWQPSRWNTQHYHHHITDVARFKKSQVSIATLQGKLSTLAPLYHWCSHLNKLQQNLYKFPWQLSWGTPNTTITISLMQPV